jgi:hypothetical protein
MKRFTLLILAALALLACTLPSRVIALRFTPTPAPRLTHTRLPTLTRTPTVTRTLPPTVTPIETLTPTPTLTLTPSITPSPTDTTTPTITSTPTATFTPIPPTATNTVTPIPPSLTPGPNEITSGQDAWRLVSLKLVNTIFAWGVDVTPFIFNHSPWGYRFLRMDFECLTGRSLISLHDGTADDGLTLVYNRTGYPTIYVIDSLKRTYRVGVLARCWLAATVPYNSSGFTLYFDNLPPFKPVE